MVKLSQELIYEDAHGRGQVRTVWADENGTLWVRWYGALRRVELVRLPNWPSDGKIAERYVIQWDGHMV